MELTRDPDGTIVVRKQVEDHLISFRATGVRRERGKPRATVTIGQGDLIPDEDEFALTDRDRRNRFANSAHKALNGLGDVYPQQQLQHDLLLFCRQVWPFQLEQTQADFTYGADEDSEPPFILRDYVIEGGGTILFAPPGRRQVLRRPAHGPVHRLGLRCDLGRHPLPHPVRQLGTRPTFL